jgi:hypothetical protein
MSNTLIELTVLEAVMNDEEEYANELVMDEMSPEERARLAMYCSTIIRMCMGTWENYKDD